MSDVWADSFGRYIKWLISGFLVWGEWLTQAKWHLSRVHMEIPSHFKKLVVSLKKDRFVLITWLLNRTFFTFNMAPRRLQLLHSFLYALFWSWLIFLQSHEILIIWLVNQKREHQTILNEVLTDRCRTIRKIKGFCESIWRTFTCGGKFSKPTHAHWRKIYPNLLGLATCAWSCANFLFHFAGILLKQSEISPRWAGSLLIWTHCFLYSFSKKVRSHLGESTHKMGSAHLHVNSPLIASKFLLFIEIDVSKEKWWVWKKIEAHLPQSSTQKKQVSTASTIVQLPPWNFSKTF